MRVVSRGDAQSFYFLNIFTSKNSNKIKFLKYERTVKLKNLASMRKNCGSGPNPAEDEGWGLVGIRSGSGADAIDSHQ